MVEYPYPSEEEMAWFQGLGMKRIYLDSTFKYYPVFGKILRENKQILAQTASAVKPQERELFFNFLFTASIQSLIASGPALEKACTALLRIHQRIGVYMQSLLLLLSSKGIIKTITDLETVGNLANALGMNATYVLAKGLPEVGDKLHTMADVTRACESFLAVANAAGTNVQTVFGLLFSQVRHLIVSLNDIVPVGYALIEAWKQETRQKDIEAFVKGFLATRAFSSARMKRAA